MVSARYSSALSAARAYGGGTSASAVTESFAELVLYDGEDIGLGKLEQGVEYDLVLFGAGRLTRAWAVATFAGDVYVGTVKVGANLSAMARLSCGVEAAGADIDQLAELAEPGLEGTFTIGDATVSGAPARLVVHEHGFLASADGDPKGCAVQVHFDAAGAVKEGTPNSTGPASASLVPVVVSAAGYTQTIRDAGNTFIVGDTTYAVVGVWDVAGGSKS